ncbi:MAG: AcrR family transcriptional regulator [Myxococcota bacterium]
MAERRRADGERTRERILLTALPLFAEHGYAGASIRKIAQAADVNVATLAYHFTDKEGLYSEVVQRLHADLAAHWPAELAGRNPREMVDRLVCGAWEFCLDHHDHIRLLMRHVLDRGAHPDVVVERWAGRLLDRADAIVGVFRPEWSPMERRWLVLSVQHLMVRYVLEDEAQLATMLGVPRDAVDGAVPGLVSALLARELGLDEDRPPGQ